MTLIEENRDLFSIPHGYYFAHCISADFALGAGIAVEFNKLWNLRNKLKFDLPNGVDKDCCICVDNVLNLVTKRRAYQKPTYDSLRTALEGMREIAEEKMIEKIAMPRIGCGLDRLEWNQVREMIEEIFDDMDIEILVCYL